MSHDNVPYENPVAAADPEARDDDESVKAAVSSDQQDLESIVYDYRVPGCTNLSEGEVRFGAAFIIGIAVVVVVYGLATAYGDGLQDDLQPGQSYHGEPGIGGCDDPAVCCNCD